MTSDRRPARAADRSRQAPVAARSAPPDAATLNDAGRIARLYGEMWSRFRPPRQPMAGAAITPRMLACLRHLSGSGPLTVGEQARHLDVSRAAASELVDRLEVKGLVERMRDQRDQRRVFVWLTPAGREQIEALAGRRLDEPFVRAVAALAPETRASIIDGLAALLRAADETQPSATEEAS
ncbi:MAG TPA: MarR family winged helix-turn-helix transcriptional regulator [Candidatus Binatia bacterium]|nr:MarR family winged helix-turn-helix transcriptional regulator [Candidatus Binatia bacterium]